MHQDTPSKSRARYHELLAQLTPGMRLLRAGSLSRTVRLLALAGLRQRHPAADSEELRSRLIVRLYGREFAERVLDAVPADAS